LLFRPFQPFLPFRRTGTAMAATAVMHPPVTGRTGICIPMRLATTDAGTGSSRTEAEIY
jgi:hypothetical protein